MGPAERARGLHRGDGHRALGRQQGRLHDVGPVPDGRYGDEFRARLDSFDIIFANEDESKALFEVETFDEVLQAARRHKGIKALTRSEKGCVIAEGDAVHVVDAAPVARVLDTTGAGDQFAAGFLYG